MQQPADVGGQLLGLGAGQQHAVIHGVQEPALADPPLLIDQHPLHLNEDLRLSIALWSSFRPFRLEFLIFRVFKTFDVGELARKRDQ